MQMSDHFTIALDMMNWLKLLIIKVINTPLHLAARSGHTRTVGLLLDKGASIEAIDNDGNTPLHLAVKSDQTGIVGLLLDKSALIEAMDKDESTPLHLAARGGCGYSSLAELLLGKGAAIEPLDKRQQISHYILLHGGVICSYFSAKELRDGLRIGITKIHTSLQ